MQTFRRDRAPLRVLPIDGEDAPDSPSRAGALDAAHDPRAKRVTRQEYFRFDPPNIVACIRGENDHE